MSIINPLTAIHDVTHYLGDRPQWRGLVSAIRHIIQANPYKDERGYMWVEQAAVNFPLLYLASIYLYIHAKQKDCKILLFASRDCCHWQRIFARLFPSVKSHYFHCSRKMFSLAIHDPNSDFNGYVKSLCNGVDLRNVMYVDIHGTGQHLLRYFHKRFKGTIPQCFLLSSGVRSYRHLPSICQKYREVITNLVFDVNGAPIEMLNYDLQGTLTNYVAAQGGPIRATPEYDLNRVRPYHECVDFIINHLVPYSVDIEETKFNDLLEELRKLIECFYSILFESRPIIRKYIHHIGRHKMESQKKPNKEI